MRRGLWMLALSSMVCACAAPSGVKGTGKLEPFAPAGLTNQAARGKRFALVVGIDAFTDSKFRPLRYAGKDARAMGQALGGFDEVIVLSGSRATARADILEAMTKLERKIRRRTDTVVVYFSTHGTLARAPGKPLRRYLVASDTRLDLVTQTGLPMRGLVRWMDRLKSRRKALILATCHSGAGKSSLSDELSRALARTKGAPPALERTSEASIVLSASAFQEVATENEQLRHDVYTHFLLEGIRRGDRDRDGAVTISEAHDWARERTYQFTKGAQRPTSQSSILGRDPIILRGSVRRRPRPVIYSYAPSSEGIEVRVNGRTKGVLPGGVALEPGRHKLELRARGSQEPLYRSTISVSAGERVELSKLLPQPWSWGASLTGSLVGALDASTRRDFLPWTPSVGARLGVSGVVWPWLELELEGRFGGVTDTQRAFDVELDVDLATTALFTGAGARLPWGFGVSWINVARGGVWWATRRTSAPRYRDTESIPGAWMLGASTRLEWRPWRHIRVSAQGEIWAVGASLDADPGPHWLGGATLSAGAVW